MATNALRAIRRLDFRRRIHALIDQARNTRSCAISQRKSNSGFVRSWLVGSQLLVTIAKLLAGSRYGKSIVASAITAKKDGLLLIRSRQFHSLSGGIGQEEESKAYKRVRHGLHDVLRITLNHYCPGDGKDLSLQGSDEPTVLLEKIRIIQIWKRVWKSPRPGGFLIDLDRIVRGVSGTKRKPCSRAKLGSPKFTADGWAARRKRELLRTWLQRRSV